MSKKNLNDKFRIVADAFGKATGNIAGAMSGLLQLQRAASKMGSTLQQTEDGFKSVAAGMSKTGIIAGKNRKKLGTTWRYCSFCEGETQLHVYADKANKPMSERRVQGYCATCKKSPSQLTLVVAARKMIDA